MATPIYLVMNGERRGPYSLDQLKEMWEASQVAADAMYWYRGMDQWASVTEFQPPPEGRMPLSEIVLTTAHTTAKGSVEKELDIVSAECVFGMNVFSDLAASVRDAFGGRSETTQKVLREARQNCLNELRKEAGALDADAVIGVDLDYSEFSGQGKSMLFLVASGTAVRLRFEPPPVP